MNVRVGTGDPYRAAKHLSSIRVVDDLNQLRQDGLWLQYSVKKVLLLFLCSMLFNVV